jgi:hypothetical protein
MTTETNAGHLMDEWAHQSSPRQSEREDTLRRLLTEAIREIEHHNAEYKHVTTDTVLNALRAGLAVELAIASHAAVSGVSGETIVLTARPENAAIHDGTQGVYRKPTAAHVHDFNSLNRMCSCGLYEYELDNFVGNLDYVSRIKLRTTDEAPPL